MSQHLAIITYSQKYVLCALPTLFTLFLFLFNFVQLLHFTLHYNSVVWMCRTSVVYSRSIVYRGLVVLRFIPIAVSSGRLSKAHKVN